MKQALAFEPYRDGKISSDKTAEVAGARNKWEILNRLSEHEVPIRYTAQDAKSDLKTVVTF